MSKTPMIVAAAALIAAVGALLILGARQDTKTAARNASATNATAAGASAAGASAVTSASGAPHAEASARPEPWSPARIPKVDMHTHIDPDVAVPARKLLEGYGIGRAINLSGGYPGAGLEETLATATETGGYYVVFVNIDFDGIGTKGWAAREVKQLERAKAMGARGVKIFKNLGLAVHFPDGRRVPVDDPVLDPLFDAMARLGMPLAIHTGDPKAFFEPIGPTNERLEELASHPSWSFADRSRFPPWEDLYGEFERRVKRSSKTTIIGVHFGNAPEEPDRVGRMLDTYPNFYVDTAARVPELGRRPAEVRRTILAHPDRILFGSDIQLGQGSLVLGAGEAYGHTRADVDHFFVSSWEFFETADRSFSHPTPIQGNWKIDGIDLPRDVLEKIYHQNAERLLGLPPTPLVPAPAPQNDE